MADERPVQGVAWTLGFHMFKSDGTVIADPGGLAARVTNSVHPTGTDSDNEPAVIDSTGGYCELVLSATEMTSRVNVLITSTDSGAVPSSFTLYPDPETALLPSTVGGLVLAADVGAGETLLELLEDIDAEVDTAAAAAERGAYRSAIWLDTEDGVDPVGDYAEEWVGVYGTPTAPVATFALAMTIADELNLKELRMTSDSSITFDRAMLDWTIITRGSIDLGGQDISDTKFEGAYVTGTSSGDNAEFWACALLDVTAGSCYTNECAWIGTFTMLEDSTHTHIGTVSGVPGLSTPSLQYPGTGDTACGLRNYSGGIHVKGMTTGDRLSLEGQGQIKIFSDCDGGTIALRGAFTVTDEVVGGFAGTLSDNARMDVTHISSHVWSESSRTLTTAGENEWTYTLTSDVDAAPIVGANVWVSSDSAGAHIVATGTTNVSGQVTFYLPSGTWYVWRQALGWDFTNPDTEVIA